MDNRPNIKKEISRGIDIFHPNEYRFSGGTLNYVAIIKGELFKEEERLTENIHAFAWKNNLNIPENGIAFLLREVLLESDFEKMGLDRLVIFHEPVLDWAGDPQVAVVEKIQGIGSTYGGREKKFCERDGFVFMKNSLHRY